MSFGAQFLNNANQVQIDDNYRNLLLIGQGTYSGAGAPVGGVSATYPFQSSCFPLLAVRPATDGVFVGTLAVTRSGAVIEASGAFSWAAFGLDSPINTTGSTNFGLQVFNASNQVIFDSRYEASRIRHIVQAQLPFPPRRFNNPASAWPAYPYTWTFPGWGQRPWIVLNSVSLQSNEIGQIFYVTTSGTTQVIARAGTPSGTSAPPSWAPNGPDGELELQADIPSFGQVRLPLLQR